ncbi:hypothetical protein [Fodinicola feengrottensis]|nr:hypothetical protein [Fodinicola feengrottensis]
MLADDINSFVANWNLDCVLSKWTATADEIIDKICNITSQMAHLFAATEIADLTRQAE